MSRDVGRHSCCKKYTLSEKYCSRTIASYIPQSIAASVFPGISSALFVWLNKLCLVCFSVAGVVSCTGYAVAIYSNFLTLWRSAEWKSKKLQVGEVIRGIKNVGADKRIKILDHFWSCSRMFSLLFLHCFKRHFLEPLCNVKAIHRCRSPNNIT